MQARLCLYCEQPSAKVKGFFAQITLKKEFNT